MFVKVCVLAVLISVALAQRPTPPAPSECQICEHLIAQARHHFNNNVKNEKALQQEDIQAGDRDGQTCFDIGACTSIPTFQTRPYHTRPPTNLRAQR
ncbi:hypothetical protein OSTOST_19581, partial [Ostertagia ostertagi]